MKCKWTETLKDDGNGNKIVLRCGSMATKEQLDKNGKPWSSLCDAHDEELSFACKSGSFKLIMRCYVRASGGPKALAESMWGEMLDEFDI